MRQKHRSGMHQSTCGRGANGKFIPMRRTVKARKSGILKSQQENIWKTEDRLFPCSRSIFACASQILEEVERKKQIYKSERLRIQTLAALVYLLAQQFLNSTALLKELGQEQKADAEAQPDFSDSGDAGTDRKHPGSRGEVISPKRLTKHRLYVKNSQGEELGYLFVSGRLYVLCCHPADGTTPCKGSHESC